MERTFIVVCCLGIQSFAVYWQLRRHWRRATTTVGFWFLVACVLYHGVTELLQLAVGGSPYGELVSMTGRLIWLVYVSLAILLFSFVFSQSLRKRKVKSVASVRRMLHGKTEYLEFAICLAALVFCVAVIGGSSGRTHFVVGIVAQYFLPLLITTSAMANVYTRCRLSILLVGLQVVAVLLMTDSRTTIVMVIVAHFVLAHRHGLRHRRWLLFSGVIIGAILFLGISQKRATFGRDDRITQKERFERLLKEIGNVDFAILRHSVIEVAGRIDGNSFAAIIVDALRIRKSEYVGMEPLWALARLAVPSFIDTEKHRRGKILEDEGVIGEAYGFPPGIDYLPSLLGTVFSYYGEFSLVIGVIVLAIALGKIDTWLQSHYEPKAVLLWAQLFICFSLIEQGMRAIIVAFRGTLLLFLLFLAIDLLAKRRPKSAGFSKVPDEDDRTMPPGAEKESVGIVLMDAPGEGDRSGARMK